MTSGIAAGNIHFTYAQLEGLWIQAGGNTQAAPVAAAIAMAESSGNSAAYDMDTNGSIDRGLWQINSVHGAQSTYDIMGNARAAVALSNNGTTWSPWVTYQTGAYRQYLQGGITPDQNVPINATNAAANIPNATLTSAHCNWVEVLADPGGCALDPGQAANPASNAISGAIGSAISGVIGVVLNPIINILAGVVGITGGGVLMIIGIYMIVTSSETGQRAIQGGQRLATFIAPETRVGGAGPTTIFMSTTPSGVRQRTTTRRIRTRTGGYQNISTREQLVQQADEYGQPQMTWRPIPHRNPRQNRPPGTSS